MGDLKTKYISPFSLQLVEVNVLLLRMVEAAGEAASQPQGSFPNMCIRPWQGRLVHFEKKLPGANVVGSQPIGALGDLDFPLAIDPPESVQNGTKCTKCTIGGR